jgi:hypothetical protein
VSEAFTRSDLRFDYDYEHKHEKKTRFPEDFAFQLTKEKFDHLRSQIVISSVRQDCLESQFVTTSGRTAVHSSQTVMSSRKHRGRHYRSYAFTEQGVAIFSSVLRSQAFTRPSRERSFYAMRSSLLALHCGPVCSSSIKRGMSLSFA